MREKNLRLFLFTITIIYCLACHFPAFAWHTHSNVSLSSDTHNKLVDISKLLLFQQTNFQSFNEKDSTHPKVVSYASVEQNGEKSTQWWLIILLIGLAIAVIYGLKNEIGNNVLADSKYKKLYDEIGFSIITMDHNFNIYNLNSAALTFFSLSKKTKRLKLNFFDQLSPEDAVRLKNKFDLYLKNGNQLTFEAEIKTLDGIGKYVHVQFISFDSTSKQKSEITAVIHNLSEYRIELQQKQKSMTFQANILKTLPYPLYYTTTKGILIGCNTAFATLVNKELNEIKGLDIFDLFPLPIAKAVNNQIIQLSKSPGSNKIEQELLLNSDKKRQMLFLQKSFSSRNNGVDSIIGTILDITENKNIKKTLSSSIDAKNRELTSFSILVSEKDKLLKQINRFFDDWTKKRILQKEIANTVKDLNSKINSSINLSEDWNQFKLHFETIHPLFFEKLKTQHPDLTYADLKHCAYMRINLSNKDVANLLNINTQSVIMAKYRLKKKFKLKKEDSLSNFIHSV